jgi:hypothetical protein
MQGNRSNYLQCNKPKAGNRTYKKLELQCSVDSFLVPESFILSVNVCCGNIKLVVAVKRYS